MDQALIKTRELGLKGKLKSFLENKELMTFVDVSDDTQIINISHINEQLVVFVGEVKIRKLQPTDTPMTGSLKVIETEEQELFIDLDQYTYTKYGAGVLTFPNLVMINGVWIEDLLEGEVQVSYQQNESYIFQVHCTNG